MKKLYFLFFITLSFLSLAQSPGDVAQNFGSRPGFDRDVNAVAMQTDGKILVGGKFNIYKGITENYIIRLNPDGSKDTTFNSGTGFGNFVYAIAVQPDGKILIGGSFSSYNGVSALRIIRLNPDGSIDITFNTGTGFDYDVYSIVLRSDGKIIVGGDFTSFNGVTANRIIRLNSDGSKDTSFAIDTGFNYRVGSVAMQSDGKIVVGGDFTSYKGVIANRIIRLNSDGTKDTSFVTGTGFAGFAGNCIYSIAVQTDGKILVGGNFYSYKGVTENNIIRLNSDGSKDAAFNTGGVFGGFNMPVHSIFIQPDGKILVGGSFGFYKGVTANGIIRLNPDGSNDTFFTTGIGFNNIVYSIALMSDGKILAGGNFTTYKGVTEKNIICLNSDGTKDTTVNFGAGFTNTVYTVAVQNDGKILVGGTFTAYNRVTENYIARLNPDGSKDTTFYSSTGFGLYVFAIAVQPDGKILVGGDFDSYEGVAENNIIRLNSDGSKDTTFITGSGFDSPVLSIVLQPDGKMLIGGNFNSYKGVAENKIIRINSDGSKDNTFITGTGFDLDVDAIGLQPDGKILVGGRFRFYKGVGASRIIRLNSDGSKDTTFYTGTGFNDTVYSIGLQPDGKILVGGGFTSYNGVIKNRIIRLNSDGGVDTTFNMGTGFNGTASYYVNCHVMQPDGKIVVGGLFRSYQGVPQNHITRLNPDGSKDNSFNTGTGFDSAVFSIALKVNGNIVIGGGFSTYKDSNESACLIELYGTTTLSNESFTNPNEFSLWPNPVKDVLNIDSLGDKGILSTKTYDLHGKLMFENAGNIIDVRSIPVGLYLIKIKTVEGEFSRKFIKE